MKTMMKGLMAVLLLIASGAVVIAGDVAIQDEPLPPEVKKLIGMKIPPIVVGMAAAKIPNYISHGGALIDEKFGEMLAYTEGMASGKWPVFIVQRIDKDRYMEILDVRLLPADLIDWRFVAGDFKRNSDHFKYIRERYSFSQSCRPDGGEIIFGLIKPEKGKEACEHDTSHVKRAWQIDRKTGRISLVPPQGLMCHYLLENQCM